MNKEILVYDNYLNNNDFSKIKDTMLSSEFPWYFNSFIDYTPDESEYFVDYPNNFQFVHWFYRFHNSMSNHIHILDAIVNKIKPTALIRIKANLLTRTESIIRNEFHVDFDFKKSKTAIFYVNSNNGKTIFESGDEIESVENRLVVFDCDLKHTGTTCTDEKVRCVINFNYYKEDL